MDGYYRVYASSPPPAYCSSRLGVRLRAFFLHRLGCRVTVYFEDGA